MGVELRLLPELAMGQVNELFIQTQPAHLQKISGKVLDTADRNIARATFLRHHLGRDNTRGQHEEN
jgi:protein arginine kinase